MGRKGQLIEYDPAQIKALKRFAKSLPRRAEAVMRYITLEMTRKTMAAIQSGAPADMKYAEYLEVLRVKSDKVGYVIAYMGKPEAIEDTDSETTVYYYKPLKRKQKGATAVLRVLREYGPYTQEMLPDVDTPLAKVVYRECTPQEVLATRQRNQKQEYQLRSDLAALGVRLPAQRSKTEIKGMEVFSDLAFKVLRREYGIRAKSNPHWRPAIRKVVSDQELANMMASPKVAEILTNPNYQGWRRIAMIGDTIPLGDLKELEDFQKMLLGGAGKKDV